MAETCTIVVAFVGLIVLTLIVLTLIEWIGEKYMDVRNEMIRIKYGEEKIRFLNEHWDEIRQYVDRQKRDG